MKKLFLLPTALLLLVTYVTMAQGADKMYSTPAIGTSNDYVGYSMVIDSGTVLHPNRGFLLLSRFSPATDGQRGLTVDEFSTAGTFLSGRRISTAGTLPGNVIGKKIIKSRYSRDFYFLGYINSFATPVLGLNPVSTNIIGKLDQDLNVVWVKRLHPIPVNAVTAGWVLEYFDLIERSSGNLAVVGRHALNNNPASAEFVAAAEINQANGAAVWSNFYTIPSNCKTVALSVAEATDLTLSVTGFSDICTPPLSTGPRKLLYMRIANGGAGISMTIHNHTNLIVGEKIVRHTNILGADEFFISGIVDMGIAPLNRQILLANINQAGNVLTPCHIGGAQDEDSRDLIFRSPAGISIKDLYLTGFTRSYAIPANTRDAYFMKANYDPSLPLPFSLNTFNTFLKPFSSYTDRNGVEIKKAGADKYAILANNVITTSSYSQRYSNVLLRDLAVPADSCIKMFFPPVVHFSMPKIPITPATKPLPLENFTIPMPAYDFVRDLQQCGDFKVDPLNSGTSGNNSDNPLKQLQQPVAAEGHTNMAKEITLYPNPVKEQLTLNWKEAQRSLVINIYNLSMQWQSSARLLSGNSIRINTSRLPAGMYIAEIVTGTQKQFIKFVKE
jgi:hypothetical protein